MKRILLGGLAALSLAACEPELTEIGAWYWEADQLFLYAQEPAAEVDLRVAANGALAGRGIGFDALYLEAWVDAADDGTGASAVELVVELALLEGGEVVRTERATLSTPVGARANAVSLTMEEVLDGCGDPCTADLRVRFENPGGGVANVRWEASASAWITGEADGDEELTLTGPDAP